MGGIEEKIQKIEDELNKFECQIGLPIIVPPATEHELNEILNMGPEERRALSKEDCANYVVLLAQFNVFLQRINNREVSKNRWAKTNLDAIVAYEKNNYDKYLKQEERIYVVVANNDVAKKLFDIVRDSQLKLDRLSYLTNSIIYMMDSLKNMQRIKQ